MRNKAALLSLVLLLAACGGSRAKADFERYEKSVEPILDEEAGLREQFQEKLKDLVYGKHGEVDDLIRKRLMPFYRRMEKDVAAIEPEGAELEGIHEMLVHYAELQNELFRVYVELDAKTRETREKEQPANEAVDKAQQFFSGKVQALQPIFRDSPDLVEKALPLFREADVVTSRLFGGLEGLRQGGVKAGDYLAFLDEQAAPFLDRLEGDLEGLELGEGAKGFAEAGKEYVAAFRGVVAAAREFAVVRQAEEGELTPLEERFSRLQGEVTSALEGYLSAAKEYRSSLR